MADVRLATAGRRSPGLMLAVGALVGWLVVQNGLLLAIWLWSAWPAAAAVAGALVKVGGLLAAPGLAAGLVAGGAAWLWITYRGVTPSGGRRLEVHRG